MGQAILPVQVHRRRSRRRTPVQRHPQQLHILTFRSLTPGTHQRLAIILVRGRMGQDAAIGLARAQARPMAAEAPLLTGISTVPVPRPTPALDAFTRRYTAFPGFVALLTAAGGYRPTIRLDLLGRDGLMLARAYDRQQAAWGDPRRAFVSGDLPAAARRARA